MRRWSDLFAPLLISGFLAFGCRGSDVPADVTTNSEAAVVAPRFVQTAYSAPTGWRSTLSATFAAPQSAGNLIVVFVGWADATTTVSSIVDDQGNSYQLAIGPTRRSGAASQSAYYATCV